VRLDVSYNYHSHSKPCGSTEPNGNVLRRKHRKTHKPPNRCNYCNDRFAEKNALYRHYAVHHPGSKEASDRRARAFKATCPHPGCDYRGRKDNVKRHRKSQGH
jgi:hypothetical protein